VLLTCIYVKSSCCYKHRLFNVQKFCNLLIRYTAYAQKNCAISKVNKKFISHLTRAQRTPSAAAAAQVSHALITVLQCVHPGSHDTHPHGNQIHPRLGVACPLYWSVVHALSDHEVSWGTWAMVVRKRCVWRTPKERNRMVLDPANGVALETAPFFCVYPVFKVKWGSILL
jgi:hypothetical protein